MTASLSSRAFAQESTDTDAETPTSEPKEAEEAAHPAPQGPAVLPPREAEKAAPATVPEEPAVAAAPKPKFGDLTLSGYLRAGFGGALYQKESPGSTRGPETQKGRMTCFSLAIPGGLVSKYRLGNECEVWSETQFSSVVYAGDDGTVADVHFMPTIYIPTTYVGYSPNGTTSSPARYTTSTGATVSFPNLYVDIKGIPWLSGGTPWVGTRYYKREAIYISDFFYWNPSGVGAGIEDIQLGRGTKLPLRDMTLSYGVFAVDGEPVSAGASNPSLPAQVDLGFRNDVQLRGIKFYDTGELQLGFQYIADWSNHKDANGDSVTHGGWGVTVQHVQKLLGGENKIAFQYGRGGGTGFGTLSRFYYPDFSLNFAPSESRMRGVEVLTVQPTKWLGAQADFVYQHDDLGKSGTTNWLSAGTRLGIGFTKHAKLLGEVGYDHVKKSFDKDPQWLAKFTIAPAITADQGFFARPELRLFYTWATWSQAASVATVDSGTLFTNPDSKGAYTLSGSTFGVQAETWW
jgi:maltoporin